MTGTFSPVYRFSKNVARVPVGWVTRRHWEGAENLPREGGFIAAANHISEFDSMTFMHFLVDNGIPVRVMAKKELFSVPALGWLLRQTGQVPVDRAKNKGNAALEAAEEALKAGECIGIYPEGTITRDIDSWPMRGKTGVARLALKARVPIVPVAQWGAQDIIGRYEHGMHILGRKDVWVRAGEPIELTDLYDRADDPEAWREGTDRVMDEIISMLEEIRGGIMPHEPIHSDAPDALSKRDIAKLEAKRRMIDGPRAALRRPFQSRS
ncbi:MAG: lysophospholipid acyltransferase family protein [Actinomycetaceae bacterium]|nr:lysophospholipid acyltransferase family protein [Actinomycetaceae bacterium]MDU0970276.1 lysophospholipid acyltransferase family protein [Actinomycetaceae bacterium]